LPAWIIRRIRIPLGWRRKTAGFGKAELSLPSNFSLYRDLLIPANLPSFEGSVLRMKNGTAKFITAMSIGTGKTVRHAEQQQKKQSELFEPHAHKTLFRTVPGADARVDCDRLYTHPKPSHRYRSVCRAVCRDNRISVKYVTLCNAFHQEHEPPVC
jgi:hypothetical protein